MKSKIPTPIFQKRLKISWQKIYTREYGVQYSEMAILCLSPKASYHIPSPSVDQIVIPEENNTAFYIDRNSWDKLVASLNQKYTSNLVNLKNYEKQFLLDGKSYLSTARKLAFSDLSKISNHKLLTYYKDYQNKLFRYSIFGWTGFILNNYVAERAVAILDRYIKEYHQESQRQGIIDTLFHPTKKAAIQKLQEEIEKYKGKITKSRFDQLYEKYKWLSCLDIHNKPWTKEEFKNHIKTLEKTASKKIKPFRLFTKSLKIKSTDLNYLLMAQRFVYIKDARDDFRRKGVYFAGKLFAEIARKIGVSKEDVTYLQEKEVVSFLTGEELNLKKIISDRRKGFVLYLDPKKRLVCLAGNDIPKALTAFNLQTEEKEIEEIKGTIASKGKAVGTVAIVRGVKDLEKVKEGNILVAVTTHPDYIPAMRKASAIITDEGGITSHAAIVSREFGIPCIVGTKNATKILHDGEKVEVEANKGLVKKI